MSLVYKASSGNYLLNGGPIMTLQALIVVSFSYNLDSSDHNIRASSSLPQFTNQDNQAPSPPIFNITPLKVQAYIEAKMPPYKEYEENPNLIKDPIILKARIGGKWGIEF